MMLKVSRIRFNYPGQTHFQGLRDISLELDRGQVLALLGGSGSGKTTAMRCIYGLEDLASGSVTLDGEKVMGPAYNLIAGHDEMRLVSQDFYILDNHTVLENITDRLPGLTNTEKTKRAEKLLRLLELSDLRSQKASTLSSGQKQRVAIARALATMPKVLLLDEPFSNLDQNLASRLIAHIVEEIRSKKKSALILVTHVAEDALRYADMVAVMEDGKIVQQGPTSEVYYNPRNARIAGLFGSCNLLRKEDLASASALAATRSRLYVRPDRLKLSHSEEGSDLEMQVSSSHFNGKCFEIVGRTHSGQKLVFYNESALPPGTFTWLRYES